MISLNYGSGPNITPFLQLLRQLTGQIKQQELDKVGQYTETEMRKIQQGDAPSIVDYYA